MFRLDALAILRVSEDVFQWMSLVKLEIMIIIYRNVVMVTPQYICSNAIIYTVHTTIQVDLVEVKKAFLERYHKTLYKMIEGDTSGDYRRLLQAIVGRDV